MRLLPQRPLLSRICCGWDVPPPPHFHPEGSLGEAENTKLVGNCSESSVSLSQKYPGPGGRQMEGRGVRGCEYCQSKAWAQNPPWKGNFPLGRGSSPSLRPSCICQGARGEVARASSYTWLQNRQGPDRGLMKPTRFTQEEVAAKGGVVAFQRDPISQCHRREIEPKFSRLFSRNIPRERHSQTKGEADTVAGSFPGM